MIKKALRTTLCLCVFCMVFVLLMPSTIAEDVKPVTVEDLKRACQRQGMRVDDNHGVEAEGLIGGFTMHLRTGEGTWLIPVVEFATEDTARAYARVQYDSGLATTLMGTIVTTQHEDPDIPPGQEDPTSGTIAQAEEGTVGSLDEVKQAAEAAGYEVGKLQSIQKKMTPGCEDGFTVKIGKAQILIFAFTDSASAQAYAQMIDASGTNAAIVSGRFLAMADVKNGAVDEDQKAALEKMLGLQ